MKNNECIFREWKIPGLQKVLRIMKLTIFLLLLSIISVFASKTYSQTKELTLIMKNSTIKEVLKNIEAQSEFYFMYSEKLVDVKREVSINIKNKKIEEVLDELFEGTNVNYKVKDRFILLTTLEVSGNDFIVQQQRVVTGKVTDESGQSLPGVTVVVKGTTQGTVTNADGEYSLTNIPEDASLVFSFVGMRMQEVVVGSQESINVVMEEEAIGIEEVVEIGYGTQRKVNMTGAVSSIKFDDVVASRPVINVSSALAGLSSGVYVKQNIGKPGSDGATIRIRGTGTLNNSNPLVIIDGMEGVLDEVNPQDIESISVLKDAASSSIYGSRAANGVILVTTRKGDGKRINVSYNGIFSIAQPVNRLDFISDYPSYMRLMNESARNIGTAEVFSANTISLWETANKDPNGLNANGVPNYVAFPNTNWNKVMYQNNLVQDHTVSVNGSTNNARFLLSAGYLDNPGLVDFTGMQRSSFRANVEIDAYKWLKVGTRTYATMTDTELGNYDNVLTYIKETTPGLYPFYNGKYGQPEAPEESASANNVYAFLNASQGDNKVFRINSTLYSKVQITKGLTWDFNFNYNKRFDEYNRHPNPQEWVKFSTGTVIYPTTSPSLMTTYFKTYSSYNYTLENLLHYETTIADKHDIKALAGYNETYFYGYDLNATKRGLFDHSAYVFDAATTMLSIGGTATDWAMRSWFGRLNYVFDQRYMLEGNMRYDGSSRFDEETRYGLFPSVSAGWRISEESFLKDSELFQNLKLRASWGELGNNASGDYDYMALYGPAGYSFNAIQFTGLRSGKIPNPLLKWESTAMANIGIDATILDGRLSAEIDAYNKVTDGILTTPPVYLTMGLIGAPTTNTAEVTNKGLEFTLGWKDKIGQVSYSITGNFGYNQNEVTKYKGKLVEEWRTNAAGNPVYYSNLGDVSSGGQNRILEGHIINEHYLMDVYKGDGNYFNTDGTVNIAGGPKDGMIRTSDDMTWLNAMIAAGYQFMPNLTTAKNKIWYGDYIYADMNGDQIYGNSYDRRFTGNSTMPKYTFGSQMNVSWKKFDLNLIWSGQAGVKIYWLEQGYNSSITSIGYQIGEMIQDNHFYYNEADPNDAANNINADYPRLKLNGSDSQNTQASTRWLYDGSYLRLKNLTLGYTLPKNITAKISTNQIRLFFSAENLLTFTSFPGLDPEMGGNTNYPVIRQIAFGTNITF